MQARQDRCIVDATTLFDHNRSVHIDQSRTSRLPGARQSRGPCSCLKCQDRRVSSPDGDVPVVASREGDKFASLCFELPGAHKTPPCGSDVDACLQRAAPTPRATDASLAEARPPYTSPGRRPVAPAAVIAEHAQVPPWPAAVAPSSSTTSGRTCRPMRLAGHRPAAADERGREMALLARRRAHESGDSHD